MPCLFARKKYFYVLCSIVVITLLNDIIFLQSEPWHWLPGLLKYNNKRNYYILLWTNPRDVPFNDLREGNAAFVSRNCRHTNCIVTSDKNLLGNYTSFDVIAFHGPNLETMNMNDLPKYRLPFQKYVFASIEAAANYPLCLKELDGFFNWTWTYKLDSEIRWGYIVIRDAEGNIIGPKKEMNWIDRKNMDPINYETRKRLRNKKESAAWFVSNCLSSSRRELFASSLKRLLKKHGSQLSIFGDCGKNKCPRDDEDKCNRMIEENFYFYLSFENAFSEDYVTEKLLIPLQHYTIPIVYGGANYSRFLPPGSYLNARELGLHKLVDKMLYLMNNTKEYEKYFRWRNHYSYHKTLDNVDTNEYCQMCALLNGNEWRTSTSVYTNFRKWWNPPYISCPKETVSDTKEVSSFVSSNTWSKLFNSNENQLGISILK